MVDRVYRLYGSGASLALLGLACEERLDAGSGLVRACVNVCSNIANRDDRRHVIGKPVVVVAGVRVNNMVGMGGAPVLEARRGRHVVGSHYFMVYAGDELGGRAHLKTGHA